MSSDDRVNETTYREQAVTPKRSWIQPITRIVARTSSVRSDNVPDAISRSAAAWTAECWRTSSSARWKPKVSTCQIRCCSSPYACRTAPAPRRESCASRRSASSSAGAR